MFRNFRNFIYLLALRQFLLFLLVNWYFVAENLEYPAAEADKVIDPSTEGIALSMNGKSKSKNVDSEEHSGVSSELTESDGGDIEVQSPMVNKRGSLNT